MTILRYPARTLIGDYIRSVVGLVVGLGVLLSAQPSWAIVAVFGGVTVLFLFFGLRTIQRHLMEVAITNTEIGSRSFVSRAMPWRGLERLKLRFYGSRKGLIRTGGSGFMQITLRGAGTSMTFESSLQGFELLAWHAAKAARENSVSLDPTSAGNLLDLGIDADSEQPPPELPRES